MSQILIITLTTKTDLSLSYLSSEAVKRPEIEIHFQYKFHEWDREKKVATFEKYYYYQLSSTYLDTLITLVLMENMSILRLML